MSHIQKLSELKSTCDTTGNCTEYYSQLQYEQSQVDAYTASANQSAVVWGVIVAVIAIAVLLTPFVKQLQQVQKFILPKLAIVAPIIIGLIAGGFIGFSISFGACYKQECSPIESSAMFTIPVISLLISVPMAKVIYSKREAMADRINRSKPLGWIIVGFILIFSAIFQTVSTISYNNRDREDQKNYLTTLER